MKLCFFATIAMFIPGAWQLQTPAPPNDPMEILKARIDGLKPATVAWRQIQWKSCLLEGLKESRERKKPLILWVFIDRPADDARC